MVEISIVIIYFICFISMVCAICTAIKLYVSGKNYLIAILAVAMAVGEFLILLSVIWINDFKKTVPKAFCVFQGLTVSYLNFYFSKKIIHLFLLTLLSYKCSFNMLYMYRL